MPALSDEYSRAIGETAVPLYKSSARSMARHVSLTKLSPRSDSTVCRPVMLSELTVHLQTRSDSPKRREVAGLFVTISPAAGPLNNVRTIRHQNRRFVIGKAPVEASISPFLMSRYVGEIVNPRQTAL